MPSPPFRPRSGADPTVVTSAYQSRGEELDERRRRYVYAMSARVVLIALSVLFLRGHLWALIPAMLVSALLPYVAVVLANGGRKRPRMATAYAHPSEPVRAVGSGRVVEHD